MYTWFCHNNGYSIQWSMTLHTNVPSKSTGGQTTITNENATKSIKICSSEVDIR
ncbi:hypothetical protein M405DRAFT_827728 [Rhizopogon salebrosus TDB-379]|nr:hypothetical protein M405DRAFT_827728 [Rhizopogon salebrosus TDB-379]